MDITQILSLLIFLAMFIAIIVFTKIHRCIPALIGAGFTIIVIFLICMKSPKTVIEVLNVGEIFHGKFWLPGHAGSESHGVNWQTIIFILGMMTMIEGLERVGFFRWLCLAVAKMVNYRIIPILVSFMLVSAILAMFIDSITVLLFLATVTIELARLLKFDPVPLIIAEIFAANVGGSATMSGDPPNIIIGTYFGFSFMDFARNTGLIAWAGMLVAILFFYVVFRKPLITSQAMDGISTVMYPEPKEAIKNLTLFFTQLGVFILVITLLVTHAETGISVAAIGMIAAFLTLVTSTKDAFKIIKKVDWLTLLFFMGLFICVGGLEKSGVLALLANFIGSISKGNLTIVIGVILWVSAFSSAIVDNIPFAATMCPVLAGLHQSMGLDVRAMSWALALGTDIGGNGTPIGASANVVGTAIAEKEGYRITWGRYCKYALPAMILVVGLCHLLLIIFFT